MTDESGQLLPTPLDEVPLHGFPVGPLVWWACTQPERPGDQFVTYDGRCPACLIAAEADLRHAGDIVGMADDYSASPVVMRQSEFIAEARRVQEALADQGDQR